MKNEFHLRCRIRNYPLRIFNTKDRFKWSSNKIYKAYRFNRNIKCALPYKSKYYMMRDHQRNYINVRRLRKWA